MKENIVFGGISVAAGEKKQGWAPVLDTDYKLPVTVINGAKEGKTVLITAGIHGCEYPSLEAGFELAEELDPAELSGQVVIICPVNVNAFIDRIPYVLPQDGKNINRLFPGNPDGTLGDKIAYVLTHEYQMRADFYIDIHGGDIPEALPPYVYNPGIGEDKECLAIAEQAALHVLSAEYRLKSSATTGAYNSCAILGVPSILIERGGLGVWSQEEKDVYKKDIINVMKFLEVYPGEAELPEKPAKLITRGAYLDATASGRWYPAVALGDKVVKGQKLGEIKDIFGNVLAEYSAEFDATVLMLTMSLAVKEGYAIITYGC